MKEKYVKETVIDSIIEVKSNLNVEDIQETDHLEDDLGLDSLDHVELIMKLEKEFNIGIPDDEFENLKNTTVKELTDFTLSILERHGQLEER